MRRWWFCHCSPSDEDDILWIRIYSLLSASNRESHPGPLNYKAASLTTQSQRTLIFYQRLKSKGIQMQQKKGGGSNQLPKNFFSNFTKKKPRQPSSMPIRRGYTDQKINRPIPLRVERFFHQPPTKNFRTPEPFSRASYILCCSRKRAHKYSIFVGNTFSVCACLKSLLMEMSAINFPHRGPELSRFSLQV